MASEKKCLKHPERFQTGLQPFGKLKIFNIELRTLNELTKQDLDEDCAKYFYLEQSAWNVLFYQQTKENKWVWEKMKNSTENVQPEQ